ncbi:MAG: TlpA family protein disulfide reductase [Steroidobacteraceae bacterium]|nr:TlpA family protein disulfide reductase [Steroidobacteraceae bacterium]
MKKAQGLIGLAVVVLAAAGGFWLQRLHADRPGLKPDTTPVVPPPELSAGAGSGADASATADASAASAPRRVVPETLPDITLPDAKGTPRKLTEWKGRPLIVNFWATWCGPCREEIPLLKTLRAQHAQDRLEVIGIAIDAEAEVLKYARDIGIDYPILIGEKEGFEAAEKFGVALVLPFSVFADARGRIVTLKVGELHADEAAYILDRVRDVDAERLELTAAREQIADKMRELAVERGKKTAQSG